MGEEIKKFLWSRPLGHKIMEIDKYIITYKVGNDIPIYSGWIRDQVKAAVAELQAKLDKKKLPGQHILTLE